MNKTLLMGRLTKDPEVKYTQAAEPMAIARYTLAVNRKFKKEGEPDADFLNIVAFGKNGEFAEKYFVKGQQVAVVGHLQTGNYTNKDGVKVYTTDVIVEEQHFAESKKDNGGSAPQSSKSAEGFVPISRGFDDDDDSLPF